MNNNKFLYLYSIDNLNMNNLNYSNNLTLFSPMDQFEIKPFFGQFLGLNYTPLSVLTNLMVYIGLVVAFIILFYIYGTFKNNIKING